MLVIDSHIHLWRENVPSPPHRQVSHLSAEEALKEMDAAGVDAAVIQPPNWDPNANAVAEDAAKRYPNRFAILGWFPPEKPDSRALVADWKKRPGQKGLRFTFMRPGQEHWASDGTMEWLWPAAERAGLVVAMGAANFLPVVGQIAERFPGLKLVVDHFGAPPRATGEAAWANQQVLLGLAKHKNIAVKVSGGPSLSRESYPFLAANLLQRPSPTLGAVAERRSARRGRRQDAEPTDDVGRSGGVGDRTDDRGGPDHHQPDHDLAP